MSIRIVVEGQGIPCIVPVPSIPSIQQAELDTDLRRTVRFGFVRIPERRPFTPNSLVADIDEVLSSFGADRVHLLGMSSLGYVAAHYARERPEHVASLILVATPASLSDLDTHQKTHWHANASDDRKAQLERNLAEIKPDRVANSERLLAFARAYAPQSWMNPLFDPRPLVEKVDAQQMQAFRSMDLKSVVGSNMSSLLEKLSCPVLQIHGRYDFVAPLSSWEGSIANVTKNVILENSAHHPSFEESEAFNTAFVSWLRRANG